MSEWEFSIEIPTSFYGDLRRTDVTPEGAIREMLDNSTSSFEDHRDVLEKISPQCCVWINWDDEKIVVQDNAYGMNREELQRAFRLSDKAPSYSEKSRGGYGLGLKYGALALGAKYTVETMQFGSGKKLVGCLDSEELQASAADKTRAFEYDTMPSHHGTKITIEGLGEYKYNSYFAKPKKLDNLKKKIAVIYADDLREGRLHVFFNGIQINEWDPVYQKDANGVEVFRHFTGEFDHNGKNYKYTGFVGQLRTADVAGAGFSLLQKKRAIEINYRPSELFGQSNDFRYQRLYGEIQLHGNNWIVSFTKSKLKFEEGVEELFIQSLQNCKEIREVQKFAKEFRKKDDKEHLSPEIIEEKRKQEEKKANQPSTSQQVDNYAEEKKAEHSLVGEKTTNYSGPDSKPADTFVLPEPKPVSEYSEFTETTDNNRQFRFSVKDDPSRTDGKFYKLVKKNDAQMEYYLYVDSQYGLFGSNSKNSNEKYFNIRMAIKLALAQLLAESRGVKKSDSQIYIDLLNELWRK